MLCAFAVVLLLVLSAYWAGVAALWDEHTQGRIEWAFQYVGSAVRHRRRRRRAWDIDMKTKNLNRMNEREIVR